MINLIRASSALEADIGVFVYYQRLMLKMLTVS